MADWKDILSDKEEEMNDDELMKYLDGDLSEEEKHELEKKITASAFANDAVEGLQEYDNKKDLGQYVQQLNKELHQHLADRKLRKQRRKLKDYPWIYIAVIIILGICVLGYVVIKIP